MPAQWTGEVIGKMHLYGVTKKRLAVQLGCTPEYVSMVLNGHREPAQAENRFRKALDELIARTNQDRA